MPHRLLLVDDDTDILLGMRQFFQVQGFDVDCTEELEEAEALLGHVPYDCLIADLCLTQGHGPDGLSVVAFAKSIAPRTRIVVLTAMEESSTEAEARRLGADAFLRKPAPLAEVAWVVKSLVGIE